MLSANSSQSMCISRFRSRKILLRLPLMWGDFCLCWAKKASYIEARFSPLKGRGLSCYKFFTKKP